jgi:two-component system, chemotaxis family, protein-glutamate methylesterase/glutaminase
MQNRDVVVIGASAGGVGAISRLTSQLREGLPASVVVAIHISRRPSKTIHLALCGRAALGCELAANGTALEPGHIYVTPPDRHTRIICQGDKKKLQVDRAPPENRSRPSIDALFRSTAATCGPRAVGVLLTGYLDDGIAGLAAIQRAGGRIIVQDPGDAEVPELPLHALESMHVELRLKLDAMAGVLWELTSEKVDADARPMPADLEAEASIAARAAALWPDVTFDDGGTEIDRALYTAIRVTEEKARFLRRLARKGHTRMRYHEEADMMEADAQVLRNLLTARE